MSKLLRIILFAFSCLTLTICLIGCGFGGDESETTGSVASATESSEPESKSGSESTPESKSESAEPKTYVVSFVDENDESIGKPQTLKKGESPTAPDLSAYESKHLVGYKAEISDGQSEWGELIKTLPSEVNSDVKYLAVMEDHNFTVKYDDDGHYTECLCGKKTEVISHTLTVKSETEAGCETDGVKVLACECGYEKSETLKALGHKPSEWTPCDEGHRKTCLRCNATIESGDCEFAWAFGENAYENKCGICSKVEKSLAKNTLDTTAATNRFEVKEGEEGAVSLADDKITVNLSTETAQGVTSLLLDKKYGEFALTFKFKYTSTGHTGERYATVKIGDYSVKYYPYNGNLQVVFGTETQPVAMAFDGSLPEEIAFEIKVIDRKLYVSANDTPLLRGEENDYIASDLTESQTIGVYAYRVGFIMSDINLYCGEDGVDRIRKDVYDSEALKKSTVVLPKYDGNAVTFDDDKIIFALSKDTPESSADYDTSVTLGKTYRGDFRIDFDLTYGDLTGYTQTRFLEIQLGGVSFAVKPSEEKVLAMRGTHNAPASGVYATEQKVEYMTGRMTVKLENGNVYFYHNGNRLAFNGDENFYFSGIDSSEGLSVTFNARRLNAVISNLTVTEL